MTKKYGTHTHHIIPIHAGGTDDPSNLIEVTPEEHYKLHYERWIELGSYGDLCACRLLKNNHLSLTPEEQFIISSKGGKAAQKTLRKIKKCSFYNPELRKKAAMKGVESNRINGTGFHDSKFQSEMGKRGGPKNKGFVWINDGTFSIKYTPKQQKKVPVEEFMENNPQYSYGMVEKNDIVTCPHCDKSGHKAGMVTNHFDNCPTKTGKSRTFKLKTKECPYCGFIGAGAGMTRFHFDNCKQKG